jgi:hypothetical protein
MKRWNKPPNGGVPMPSPSHGYSKNSPLHSRALGGGELFAFAEGSLG